MSMTARILKILIRLLGVAALLLGLMIWAGYGFSWLPVHILLGTLFVVTMWGTSALAFVAGTRRGLATLVFLWGLGVVWFGRAQMALLPGPRHWIVQLAHLLAGGVAMGLGYALAVAVEHSRGRAATGAPALERR